MLSFIFESIGKGELMLLLAIVICFFVALGIGIFAGKKFIKPKIATLAKKLK